MAAVMLFSALSLQGCSSADKAIYGPIRPLQAGYIGDVTSCDVKTGNGERAGIRNDYLEDRFVAAACASAAKSDDDALARKMMETSFTMTNARCNDFFAQKAGSQSLANTARSSVGPILTLLTGILSIVEIEDDLNGAKRARWEKGLSLASSATLAGLSIYEEQFLFSAENIDDVRALTRHAMNEYRLAVLGLKSNTFDTSVDYMLEYSMTCTPGKIKGLVKQAIKDKKITVIDRGSGAAVAPAAVATPTAGASLETQ